MGDGMGLVPGENQCIPALIRLSSINLNIAQRNNNDFQPSTRERRIARATQAHDGKVVAVDNGRSKIFVDIGAKDLVRRAIRFQIFGGVTGNERSAMAT
jgi:hypothetical protein